MDPIHKIKICPIFNMKINNTAMIIVATTINIIDKRDQIILPVSQINNLINNLMLKIKMES